MFNFITGFALGMVFVALSYSSIKEEPNTNKSPKSCPVQPPYRKRSEYDKL